MEKDFVKVYTTTDPYQADMAHDILDECHIHCVILNQHDSMIPTIGEMRSMYTKMIRKLLRKY